ncbi:Multiple coagulation factor deficiency protein 2 -like protein [Trichinella murrelli]|uniref:Multiple coagulation factor deficiency protein 2-like protein n=1 Tax=Trichinella murrelli TaxID=144512 RepID=A0A0V0TDA2_9BILA|nr:Multiple coagulation factor deficiency protein 2 -like protein [Trichinella murrelli]
MHITYVWLLLYYLTNNAAANEPHSTHFGQKDDVEDVEHMKKHLHGRVDTNSMDNPEMMRFYYFNLHDLNKDNRLDGLEIIKAITHYHKDDHNVEVRVPSDDELEAIVDGIMESDDFNRDALKLSTIVFVDYKAKFFYEHRFLVPRVDKVTVDGDKNMTKLYDLLVY